ncbi:MAG: EF-hand domain-containing protein [Pseudomonadota bacterium]
MKKLLLAIGLTAFPLAAYAASVDFSTADADGSGTVTMEEAMAAMPDVSADAVAAADSDGDGVLTVAEYEALTSQ